MAEPCIDLTAGCRPSTGFREVACCGHQPQQTIKYCRTWWSEPTWSEAHRENGARHGMPHAYSCTLPKLQKNTNFTKDTKTSKLCPSCCLVRLSTASAYQIPDISCHTSCFDSFDSTVKSDRPRFCFTARPLRVRSVRSISRKSTYLLNLVLHVLLLNLVAAGKIWH